MVAERLGAAERQQELTDARRNQLLHASEEIRARLKNIKLSKEDREIFARNLGEMYQNSQNWRNRSLLSLLTQSFGEADGLAKNKKRKALVLLPNELPPESYELRARAYDYIALAEHLCRSPGVSKLETDKLAVAKLVHGSSFDYQASHLDRMKASTLVDVYKCLNDMTRRVLSSVDMNWLYAWSQNHPYKTVGPAGKLESIGFSRSETSINYEVRGPVSNNTCPCINLGTVDKELKDISGVNLGTVESCSDQALLKKLRSRFDQKLCEAGLCPISDYEYIGDEETDPAGSLAEIFDMLAGVQEPVNIETTRRLDLEIRYDSILEHWKTCLLLRPIQTESYEFDDLAGKTIRIGLEVNFVTNECFSLLAIQTNDESWVAFHLPDYAATHFIGECVDSMTDCSNFLQEYQLTVDQLIWDKTVFGYEQGSQLFDSLLLKTAPSIGFNDDWATGDEYTPAPTGSVAEHILKNFCFAPANRRIDELLLADAREKFTKIAEFAEQKSKGYRTALNARLGR